jgi:Subtilase family
MTIYWPETQPVRDPAAEDSGFVLGLPEELLQRHGARVLDPAAAPSVEGVAPAERSTVYQSAVLLVPPTMMNTLDKMRDLNVVLAAVGMQIPPDKFIINPDLPELPQPLVLRPSPGATPVVVDAAVALTAIRASKLVGKEQCGLSHLLFAAVGDLGGVPGAIQGVSPPFGQDSATAFGYLQGPVVLEMPPIHRRSENELPLGRRPVIAVLDTGVAQNSRLEIGQLPTNVPPANWPLGPYVKVDKAAQDAVFAAGDNLLQQGLRVEVIKHPKDEPLTRNPLYGDLARCSGHGVFATGIIQQIAPDATVLAVRVMGTDGVAKEEVVAAALDVLVKRVDRAQATGDMSTMVDVVSLSMGCPYEGPIAEEMASPIAVQIKKLRERGVLVVASAGNSSSGGRFFPACMSTHADNPKITTPPVINVGALNPNGSKALFSNESKAVTCYAPATNVISTFPQDINASRQPLIQVAATNRADLPQSRQSPDTDDYTLSAMSIGSGTSFAAPYIAAHLANALHGMVATGTSEITRKEAAMDRAAAAVDAVRLAAQPKP